MEAIQEIVGTHQDSVVIRDQLRQLAVTAHLDGENAFTYGLLHGLEHCRAADTRRQYHDAWTATTTRKLHRWLHP
jgi:CHAD domain-containing protein